MDSGPDVTDVEFHDWYDNEHIALRMQIPAFRTATRWIAADDKHPQYLATYDLSSLSALTEEPYLALRQNQSEREKDVIARLQLVDRRMYDPLPAFSAGEDATAAADELAAADYDPRAPGPYLVAVEIAVRPEDAAELARWYAEEHLGLLARVPGWRRSRRFVLREHGPVRGTNATVAGTGAPPRFLAVHEWASMDGFGSAEFARATSTEWRARMVQAAEVWERRTFKVLRSWVQQ